MNHSEWRTRRRQMLGEHLDTDPEYDRVYEEAGLAMTLGKAVYDRHKQLGLSEADLAERMHVDVEDIEGIETATKLPPIAVIMRLARALDITVDVHLAGGDEPTVTIVAPAAWGGEEPCRTRLPRSPVSSGNSSTTGASSSGCPRPSWPSGAG
ncbi:multiprotein-bridging factor 1 family protein [Streptomyces coelicoflavus]|uniref:helix-turn-helix domain-containing protein n=1 Tax=Streptomyces coelicoflavus TaxID=285562 RepID=UPI0036B0EA2C